MTTRSTDPHPESRPGRRPADRRDRLVATAARLFRERGFHATGIDDIGAAEDMTGPAVYRHFPTKEALLVACAEQGLSQVEEAFAAVDPDLGPEARLRALVRAGAAVTVEHLDEMVAYMRERRHLTAEHRLDLRKRARANTDVLLDALLAVRPDLTRVHGVFALQSLNGIYLSIADQPSTVPAPRLTTLLSDMGAAAVLAPTTDIIVEPHHAPAPVVGPAPGRVSKREQILTDSMRLFREHGYASVGMGQIGDASGLKGSSLYRHFASKADLLAAGINRIQELFAAAMTDALSAPNVDDAVERLVVAVTHIAVQHRDLIAVELSDGRNLEEEARERARRHRKEHMDEWARLLCLAEPELSVAEARTAAAAAIGVAVGYVQGTLDPERASARHALQAMMEAALAAARPAPGVTT